MICGGERWRLKAAWRKCKSAKKADVEGAADSGNEDRSTTGSSRKLTTTYYTSLLTKLLQYVVLQEG